MGRIGSFPTPKNPSVCGTRSTPFLVVAGSSRNALAFTAEDFLASHTADKIVGIPQATEGSPPPHHPSTDCSLSSINEVTAEEFRRIIIGSPPKSFIHSDHFYGASSSPLLLRSAPDIARILCRSFTPKRNRQL